MTAKASGRNRRGRVIRGLLLGSAVIAVTVLAAGCRCIPRHPYASYLALTDVAAQDAPSRLKRSTPEPPRDTISYEIGGRAHRADMYHPASAPKAGLVLVPGAAELGKDDPRLVAFARTLARMQFTVMVPDLESVRKMELGSDDIRDLADALTYLASQPHLAPEGRTGIAALSYAVGPAVLAALQPDVRTRVQFIVGIGGYHNIDAVVTFFTTGYFRDATGRDGGWKYAEPNEYGKWAFVLSNARRLSDERDRATLEKMALSKMEQPETDIDPLAGQLGAEGRAYFDLINNRDPERVPQLLARLPEEIRSELAALDVARHDLSGLRARLILFHGRDDAIIPYTESIALANAAPRGQAQLHLLDGLAHVDLNGVGFRDRLRLLCGMDAILRERSR